MKRGRASDWPGSALMTGLIAPRRIRNEGTIFAEQWLDPVERRARGNGPLRQGRGVEHAVAKLVALILGAIGTGAFEHRRDLGAQRFDVFGRKDAAHQRIAILLELLRRREYGLPQQDQISVSALDHG